MLGNDVDAQDATQQTMLAVVRSISRFDSRSTFATWVYRIATNSCVDELRRRKRHAIVGISPSAASSVESCDPGSTRLPRSATLDPARAATDKVDVDVALGKISTEFRCAVVLRDICDLPYDEIAAVLEVPVGTVRSRIARGRAMLADLLDDEVERVRVDERGNFARIRDVKQVLGEEPESETSESASTSGKAGPLLNRDDPEGL
jgi:RNA polymerase sigma-70 factor (ECF subfamily)